MRREECEEWSVRREEFEEREECEECEERGV